MSEIHPSKTQTVEASTSVLTRIRTAIDAGDTIAAEALFDTIDDRSPLRTGANILRFLIARQNGDLEGADRYVRKFVDLITEQLANAKTFYDDGNQITRAAAVVICDNIYDNTSICPELCSEAMAQALNLKAVVLEKGGSIHEAEDAIDQAAAIISLPDQRTSHIWPTIAVNQATIKASLGKLDEGYDSLMRAIVDFAQIDDTPRRIALLTAAADIARRRERYIDVRQHYLSTLSLVTADPSAEPEQHARALTNLAVWELEFGHAKRAREYARAAHSVCRDCSEPEPLWLMAPLIATELHSVGDLKKIRPLLKKYADQARRTGTKEYRWFLADLAVNCMDRRKWHAAVKVFAKAFSLAEQDDTDSSIRRISDRRHYARALAKIPDLPAAEMQLNTLMAEVEALGEQAGIFVHVLQRDLAEVTEMAGD